MMLMMALVGLMGVQKPSAAVGEAAKWFVKFFAVFV